MFIFIYKMGFFSNENPTSNEISSFSFKWIILILFPINVPYFTIDSAPISYLDLNSRLPLFQQNLSLNFMEKNYDLKFSLKQIAKQKGCSDSTVKRYRK